MEQKNVFMKGTQWKENFENLLGMLTCFYISITELKELRSTLLNYGQQWFKPPYNDIKNNYSLTPQKMPYPVHRSIWACLWPRLTTWICQILQMFSNSLSVIQESI